MKGCLKHKIKKIISIRNLLLLTISALSLFSTVKFLLLYLRVANAKKARTRGTYLHLFPLFTEISFFKRMKQRFFNKICVGAKFNLNISLLHTLPGIVKYLSSSCKQAQK